MMRATVMNISIKTPCARFVPCCKKVLMGQTCVRSINFNGHKLGIVGLTYFTDNGAEVKNHTMADAAMAPPNCAMQYKTKCTDPMPPTRRSVSETFGLNRPPVTEE